MATETALRAPPNSRRARALVSGIIIGQEQAAVATLMDAARHEMDHLKPLKAKPL
jgi:hypothetical protein